MEPRVCCGVCEPKACDSSDAILSILRYIEPLREPGRDLLTAGLGLVAPWGAFGLRGEEMKAPVENVRAGERGEASGEDISQCVFSLFALTSF